MEINVSAVADAVLKALQAGGTVNNSDDGVPIGISNRHIHLSREHIDILFGTGYQLTPLKELSQPGQYACKEVLTIVGPSLRPIENVRVLGPERTASQVEISRTDSYTLKVKPPVRESGKIAGSASISIIGPKGIVTLKEGCIIANRHIHMSTEDGKRFGVTDNSYVTVDVDSERRTRFYDVQVRVSDKFRLEMHLDTDDANAAALKNGDKVRIVDIQK